MPTDYFLSDFSVSIAQADDKTSQAPRKFTGIANSGKPFSYYGERAIVELSSVKLGGKVPVLALHDRSVRLGVGALSLDNNQLVINGTLLTNDEAVRLAKDADDGFPLQLSAHLSTSDYTDLKEGESITVNGQLYHYPLRILKNCTVPEVSFTPTGVDRDTIAMILSQVNPNPTNPNQKDTSMTDKTTPPADQSKDDEIAELKKQVATLLAENKELKAGKKKASIEAKLSQNGFTKNDKGDYTHLSQASFDLLLSLDDDKVDGVISDFAKGLPKSGEKDFLLSEQYGGAGDESPTTPNSLADMASNFGKCADFI